MTVSTIGLDIAKKSFHVSGLDENGKEVLKKKLNRSQVLGYFAALEPRVRIGVEACGGAHHWGRELEALGHSVKLMSPKAVKAYRTKTKNDYNDARAIAEAVGREQVRAVVLKSTEQQVGQGALRARDLIVKQRTQTVNHIRGLLAEFGVVIRKGRKRVHERVPELLEDAENGLSDELRELLSEQYGHLCALEERIRAHDRRLGRLQRANPQAQLAAKTPGVGVITSLAVVALFGTLCQYRCGRDFAAALGLVPRQYSTGGRTVLLGINKHTDPYVRTLLIHGARSVLRHAARHPDDPLCRWALRVKARRGHNIAAVALANKLARITWAVLTRNEPYNPAKLQGLSADV